MTSMRDALKIALAKVVERTNEPLPLAAAWWLERLGVLRPQAEVVELDDFRSGKSASGTEPPEAA